MGDFVKVSLSNEDLQGMQQCRFEGRVKTLRLKFIKFLLIQRLEQFIAREIDI